VNPKTIRSRAGGDASRVALACLLAVASSVAFAQAVVVRTEPVPSRADSVVRSATEPPAVAARLPEPAVGFDTPGFAPGRTGFASHAEMLAFAQGLRARTALLEVKTIGESHQGRAIPMLSFGAQGEDRPTVMVVAMQRGDAPAAGEAALVIAQRLAGGSLVELLRTVNVLIVPRANPDGAEMQLPTTAGGIDLDRDHLLLRSAEARALADVIARHRPEVLIELGEFDPGGEWPGRFGGWVRHDAMLQPATVVNLPAQIDRAAQQWFARPMRAALDAAGLASQPQHVPAADGGLRVSSGSVHADSPRNVAALRTGIVLTLESRGAGLGRAHFTRRVHTHATGVEAALRSAVANAQEIRRGADAARRAVSAGACTGELVVEAAPVSRRRTLSLLDAGSGADRPVQVDWLEAQPPKTVVARPRPCAYLVPAGAQPIADQLKLLGVSVRRVESPAPLSVERYRAGTGSGYALEPARIEAAAGDFFVSMSQPLANLAAAALEPDAPGGLVASARRPDARTPQVLRVTEPATLKATDW
jgi:hypothetical protein